MSKNDDYKLDNPVWYSLSEVHRNFSIDYNGIKFYHPDYCPFGGVESNDGISKHIADYSKLVDNFFVVGEKPELPTDLELKKELVCLQMAPKRQDEPHPPAPKRRADAHAFRPIAFSEYAFQPRLRPRPPVAACPR